MNDEEEKNLKNVFDPAETVHMVEFQHPNEGNSDQTIAPLLVGRTGVPSTKIAMTSVFFVGCFIYHVRWCVAS